VEVSRSSKILPRARDDAENLALTGQWSFRAPASIVARAWIGATLNPVSCKRNRYPDTFQKFQSQTVEMIRGNVHLTWDRLGVRLSSLGVD